MHLSDPEYANCIDEVIAEAKNANVVAMVSNSTDLKTSIDSLELAKKYSGLVYAAVGVHPWNVQNISDEEIEHVVRLAEENRENKALVAIGEVGLDFKYMKILDRQIKVFDTMLHLAEKLDLPVIIHSRGTTAQIADMLPSYRVKRVLLHWFSNPISALGKAVENGYYISEGPPVVYSNGLRDVVRRVPLTNLLTETDGPVRYFRPPFNGKRTTPAHIPTVVKAMAEIVKLDTAIVAECLLRNYAEFLELQTRFTTPL
jgi:TatD DNase family protein